MTSSPLSVAREFLERALEGADGLGRRSDVHLIAFRLCELAEYADFDEVRRLRENDQAPPLPGA